MKTFDALKWPLIFSGEFDWNTHFPFFQGWIQSRLLSLKFLSRAFLPCCRVPETRSLCNGFQLLRIP